MVVASLCWPPSAAAQGRGVAATIVASAPVTLLPDEGRAPLATLSEGTRVQVLGPAEDGWYRIAFQDSYLWGDRIGYVRTDHVEVSTATNAPPPSPSKASDSRTYNGLSGTSINDAIAAGYRNKGFEAGLRLLDTGGKWTDAPNGNGSSAATGPSGTLRLQVHTPLAWIQQLAGDAARLNRAFSFEDVADDITRPVFRVVVTKVDPEASPIKHALLRGVTGSPVVQPLSKEAFSEHVLNANGGSAVFEGLRLTFPMDAVRQMKERNGEIVIAVTSADGTEKNVTISKAQLHDLPM